jgi:DNA-binding XRE family transcriptional regulator
MQVHGWMFRAARAATGLTAAELATAAGVGLSTVKTIEASGLVQVRANPKDKRAGGVDLMLVERVRDTLSALGYDIRPGGDGWPAAVVERVK